MSEQIRPTKRQRELLTFIAEFIAAHGYSPSYREIMAGCSYTSVATVALHVKSLINRGHLRKRDKSARSLEVVDEVIDQAIAINRITETEEKWLVAKVEQYFKRAEQEPLPTGPHIDELYVLIGTLKILGLEGAAYAYIRRLNELREKKGQVFTV